MTKALHCGGYALILLVLSILGAQPGLAQLVPLNAAPGNVQPAPEIEPADYQYAERLSQLVKRVAKQSTESVVHIEAEKRERNRGAPKSLKKRARG